MAIADQVPTESGFRARTEGSDIIADSDLAGKIAIVTGGYSGIGLETVRALVGKGVRVIVPVRDRRKAEAALAGVSASTGAGNTGAGNTGADSAETGSIEIGDMDLSDLASVRSFAATMVDELPRLDFLINNAGVMACGEARVGADWESQFAINHLGHMMLSLGLMDLLRGAGSAGVGSSAGDGHRVRVIALSSTAHKRSDIRWDDVHFQRQPYEKWEAYGQAKTANALFANALSRRLKASGGLAFSVHPGGIFTPLQRHLSLEEQVELGWLNEDGSLSVLAKAGFKTPEQGCSTTLWAATSALLDGKPGVYCEDCDIAAPTEKNSPLARYRGVENWACDDESAERLWTMSEEMLAQA